MTDPQPCLHQNAMIAYVRGPNAWRWQCESCRVPMAPAPHLAYMPERTVRAMADALPSQREALDDIIARLARMSPAPPGRRA